MISDAELRAALEISLCEHFGKKLRIVEFRRRPSAYRTSYEIEEVSVRLDDGQAFRMIFKNLSRDALHDSARAAKPEFLYDPMREIEVYRSVLDRKSLGTAICYGSTVDPKIGRYWLYLEEVAGRELYQFGEFDVWKRVARWLGKFHSSHSTESTRLLQYDARYYRAWIERAMKFAPAEDRSTVEVLAGSYDTVIDRLLAMPRTLLHGEFYASNVIVADERVCPIDWEMAARGPALVDLAALISGKWTEEQKAELAAEYRSMVDARNDFNESLNLCRLHLAVQWLGWAENWSPPAEHTQDWIGEIKLLIEKLAI